MRSLLGAPRRESAPRPSMAALLVALPSVLGAVPGRFAGVMPGLGVGLGLEGWGWRVGDGVGVRVRASVGLA